MAPPSCSTKRKTPDGPRPGPGEGGRPTKKLARARAREEELRAKERDPRTMTPEDVMSALPTWERHREREVGWDGVDSMSVPVHRNAKHDPQPPAHVRLCMSLLFRAARLPPEQRFDRPGRHAAAMMYLSLRNRTGEMLPHVAARRTAALLEGVPEMAHWCRVLSKPREEMERHCAEEILPANRFIQMLRRELPVDSPPRAGQRAASRANEALLQRKLSAARPHAPRAVVNVAASQMNEALMKLRDEDVSAPRSVSLPRASVPREVMARLVHYTRTLATPEEKWIWNRVFHRAARLSVDGSVCMQEVRKRIVASVVEMYGQRQVSVYGRIWRLLSVLRGIDEDWPLK